MALHDEMIGINRQTKYSSLRKIFPFIKEALRTPKQTYCPNRWRVNADDLVGVNPFSCPVSINMFSRYAHCRKKSVKYYQNQVSPTNADDSASSHSSQHTLPLRACIIQWGTFKVGGDRWSTWVVPRVKWAGNRVPPVPCTCQSVKSPFSSRQIKWTYWPNLPKRL